MLPTGSNGAEQSGSGGSSNTVLKAMSKCGFGSAPGGSGADEAHFDAVQIDLRFTNPEQGSLAVVVAPVLRFQDVGFNADIRIEELGPPEKLIGGFAPELFGSPLQVCLRMSAS